ncbi:putative plastidic glucose transporter 3 [Hordeum vulgare]|nr:putative plastidic glucose transporter 3 [Hordeum vulgare]
MSKSSLLPLISLSPSSATVVLLGRTTCGELALHLHQLGYIWRRWRVCFWVSAVPAALQAIAIEFCAESPQWLYKCGRTNEAEMQFEKLLGPLHVKSAMAELSRSERGDDGESVKFSELFYSRHFNVIGHKFCVLFLINCVQKCGVPSSLANICMGIANLSGSIVAMLLMDKLGRKMLLAGSFFFMAFSMGLQAIGANRHLGSASVYLSVGGILLFVLAFSLGAGPVPGLLLPEIFPNKIRAKAMALCMSVHWTVRADWILDTDERTPSKQFTIVWNWNNNNRDMPRRMYARTIDPEHDGDSDPSARNALLRKLVFGNLGVAYVPAHWVWVCNGYL